MEDENEAARDPRVTSQSHLSEWDIEDHRACTVYIGYYVPTYGKEAFHRRYHRHQKLNYGNNLESGPNINTSATPPSERVHFILGDEENGSHEPHPLFSEMEELFQKGDEIEWRETARWIKFEEDVEEGGNRWSKPHVATVSLHSLFELRSCILNGSILLDIGAHNLEGIIDLVLENFEANHQISSDTKQKLKDILLRPHRHLHEIGQDWNDKSSRVSLLRSWTDDGRTSSKFSSHSTSASAGVLCDNIASGLSCRALSQAKCASPEESASENCLYKLNQPFMRKIPPRAEASNLLIGEIDFLDKTISSFVRLNESCHLGDLTEVPVPTRFLFILLGPTGGGVKYHEIGRAMATLLSDEVFHGVAYKAKSRSDLLAGVDEFLDATTVLPPGVWDPRTRIEPPLQTASQDARKVPEPNKECKHTDSDDDIIICEEGQDASCHGKFFEGLRADIHHKFPWYWSDFKDCLALQCISSVVFLYFVCIAQIILFGGALAHVTKQRMAATECLFSAVICGTVYSLFSGQPLTLLGITGPVLAFESIMFDLCEKYRIDYLSLRVWIGLWTSTYFFIFVAFNLASLVRYITRFTEEIFATLVSAYFIFKAFKNLIQISYKYPIITVHNTPYNPFCICILPYSVNFTITNDAQCQHLNGISAPDGCSYTPHIYVPNIFLLSVILFGGTFATILLLRAFKNTPFFPSKVRTYISDFSVLIAVVVMTVADLYIGLPTPKLEVPYSFRPTWSGRNWVVSLFGRNPWWSALIAMIPAIFLAMLVFMDQQITTVIVNRKENKLKKGKGYHLDLLVLTILIALCSIFGLPWFVAGTILSITHVNSLKRASHCSTPGEKPHFLGVREQRVTHLCVSVLVGLSVFFTGILQFIPMPVLYGVFLFMGVTSLKGLQFVERILLMFMPQKYQPDKSYIRYAPTKQVVIYTSLQIILCILLFICKLFKPTAFAFPFLLMGVIFSRKGLGYVLNKRYLKLLDDVMPERSRFKKSNNSSNQNVQSANSNPPSEGSDSHIKSRQNSHANINISEVLMQSSIWKCIDQQSQKTSKKISTVKSNKKKKHCKRSTAKSEDCKRLSIMEEEEDEDYTNSGDTPSSPNLLSDSVESNSNGTLV